MMRRGGKKGLQGQPVDNYYGPGRGNKLTLVELMSRFDHFYAKRGGFLMLLELWMRGMSITDIGNYFGFSRQYLQHKAKDWGLPAQEKGRGTSLKDLFLGDFFLLAEML